MSKLLCVESDYTLKGLSMVRMLGWYGLLCIMSCGAMKVEQFKKEPRPGETSYVVVVADQHGGTAVTCSYDTVHQVTEINAVTPHGLVKRRGSRAEFLSYQKAHLNHSQERGIDDFLNYSLVSEFGPWFTDSRDQVLEFHRSAKRFNNTSFIECYAFDERDESYSRTIIEGIAKNVVAITKEEFEAIKHQAENQSSK